jgi:predicted MFS family arabinose efflux permease
MNIWIAVVLLGAIFFLVGTAAVVRDYRGGRLSRNDLLLRVLAAVMVVPIVLTTILLGTPEDPAPGFAIFLPLWLALLVVIRRWRQKRRVLADRDLEG